MPQALAIVSAVATVGSAVSSYNAAQDSKKAQEQQRQVEERRNQVTQRRERLQAYRERIKADDASTISGVATGAGGSQQSISSGSVSSQYASNTAFTNMVNGYQTALNNIKPPNTSSADLFKSVSGVLDPEGDVVKDYVSSFFKTTGK